MINKAGFDRLQREYEFHTSENAQLLSYIFRCFWVGDEEEYQIHNDETDRITEYYREAIRSIGNPDAKKCEDAIRDHFCGRNKEHNVVDILVNYIWNKPLYSYDQELWFAVINDEEYEIYATSHTSDKEYRKFFEAPNQNLAC